MDGTRHDADQREPAEGFAPALEGVEVKTMILNLAGLPVRVVRNGDGTRDLVVGPVLVHFKLPMADGDARQIARDLTGGVELVQPHRFRRGRRR